MSSSPHRQRRLLAAKSLPQAHCPVCGTSLLRVEFPKLHLKRCLEREASE